MISENSDKTFIFEYISKNDIHVVCYSEAEQGLYLIGIRYVNNGYIHLYSDVINYANKYNIKTINKEQSSWDGLISMRDKYSADEK